jgi:hypothetical protein
VKFLDHLYWALSFQFSRPSVLFLLVAQNTSCDKEVLKGIRNGAGKILVLSVFLGAS